jgi:hypothetical protein
VLLQQQRGGRGVSLSAVPDLRAGPGRVGTQDPEAEVHRQLVLRMIVERHLTPALGKLRLTRLSPQDVQGYLNQTQKEPGLSARSREGISLAVSLVSGCYIRCYMEATSPLGQPPRGRFCSRN